MLESYHGARNPDVSDNSAKAEGTRRERHRTPLNRSVASVRPAVEWLFVALLVAFFLWRGLWPAWSLLDTDFPNYYLAAKLRAAGYPLDRIYDWIWFQRQKDHFGIDQDLVGTIESTPFSALLAAPLTFLPALQAKRVWLFVNIALLVATGQLFRKLTRLPLRRISLIVFLAVVPLRTNFRNGQQHLLILFLLTAAAWLYQKGRFLWSGMVVAAAAVLKLYPALLVLHFVRRRQWRALAGSLVMFACLIGGGLLLCGTEAFKVYSVQILPRLLKGEGNDPYLPSLNSPTVLFRRLFVAEPGLNPFPLIHAPLLFAFLQPTVQAAILAITLGRLPLRRTLPEHEGLDWATYVVLMLLLSPGSSTYHFCSLVLAAILVLDNLKESGDRRMAVAFLIVYAVICSPFYRLFPAEPSGFSIFLGVPRLYALIGLWLLLLQIVERSKAPSSQTVRRNKQITVALIFGVLAAVGSISQVKHITNQFAGERRLVEKARGSLITVSPSPMVTDLYFARLDERAYVIDRTGAPLGMVLPHGADAFHPTLGSQNSGWFELASTTSQIVRFSRNDDILHVADLPIEVADGEDPAISPNNLLIGFLRPLSGRGALWIADRRTEKPMSRCCLETRQVVPARYDVLDFRFMSNDRIIMSARPAGRASLFIVDVGLASVEAIQTSDRPARYPAVTADSEWIVYSEEDMGSWQLWAASMKTAERRRLTRGDCNSTMPTWIGNTGTIVYATDCGRAFGQTTLGTIRAFIEPATTSGDFFDGNRPPVE